MIGWGENGYLDMLSHIIACGDQSEDRTGTGTLSVFGEMLAFDMRRGFPLLTTKSVHWKSVLGEMLWMISGDTNVRTLQEQGIKIWDEWAADDGELGPVYGYQWRSFAGTSWRGQRRVWVDQLDELIKGIKRDPYSRRHLVTAWNPAQLGEMSLPPCPYAFQCYVRNGYIDMMVHQRSCDMFLGVPFNIAGYALLLSMIGYVTDLRPRTLKLTLGDAHIYTNHIEQCQEQVYREVRNTPSLVLDGPKDTLFDWRPEMFQLVGYTPHPKITGAISV